MKTFVAVSKYGTFSRNSKSRIYTHAVIRSDGWYMFNQSEQAAIKEAILQGNRGRKVEIVKVVETAIPH